VVGASILFLGIEGLALVQTIRMLQSHLSVPWFVQLHRSMRPEQIGQKESL
jgi:hypothetical protein